jgi:glycosyltransferase involved in cell wall biosynthesis
MKVSVVITCFNYGRFLHECLQSVLAQTYRDFEVVVVDDGSTDDTPQVVQPFLVDPRVRYHRQPNKGQAAAKNAGIRLSEGVLVAFLDADDRWAPAKLSLQVPLFANPAVGVVYSEVNFIDEQGRPLPFDGPVGYWVYRRGQVMKWLAFDNFVPFSSSVVRRTLLETHGAFDEHLRMGIDWDLWLRLSHVTAFDFVPERLLDYRTGHADQMSRNWDGRVAGADVVFRRFLAQYPEALTASELKRVAFYNACLRAEGYRRSNLGRSTALLWKALRLTPLSPDPYLGLLRNALEMILRRGKAA